jgi:hypothetical protein
MTWATLHGESEKFASAAHEAVRLREPERAHDLFKRAAQAEVAALGAIGADKPRTLGVTAVSAVALWYKAGMLEEAALLAHRASAMEVMPAFALHDLRELLQVIWNEQAQKEAGISFVPGQVVVSVKGGEVVSGGAPLDVILDKVQIVQSLFYRTAEFLKNLPLRRHGPPSKELQALCRPWLFQSVPGSYQFAVAIQKPQQSEMFPTDNPEPEALTETFLSILKAASDDPGGTFNALIPQDDYRVTFLKMTRNLAPTGKAFDQIEIRGPEDRRPIVLIPGSRKLISDTLRGPNERPMLPASDQGTETVLVGVLRALDLDHDWIDVSVDGKLQRVMGVGDVVDDLIGPMVNREVRVRARIGKQGLGFIDIEQDV